MNPLSSFIVLTLVLFSLVTPRVAFGEDCSDADISAKKVKKKSLNAQILDITDKGEKKTDADSKELSRLRADKDEIDTAIEACEKDKTDKKSACDGWKKERTDLLSKFGSSQQIVARMCVKTDEDGETEYAKAAMYAMVGQTMEGQKSCDLGGAKTTNKDKRESIDKDIEKLETATRKADADIIKKTEKTQDELSKINEDRRKMKEEWENAQEDAENAQVKAMGNLRDKQLQLADNIRKLQSAAITARQNVQSVEIELKAAMTTAKTSFGKIVNLRSESAINLACIAVAKQTNKENFGAGNSKNASSGANRVAALKEAYDNCVTELHDLRNTMSQSFANALEQRLNQQKEINEQIDSANQQYAQLTEDYNKMLEQLKGKLTKAQQRYYEKDNDLANKYNEALQRGQQEQSKLQNEKMQDQQKIIAKYNSQGKLTDDDVEEIIQSADQLDELESNLMDPKNNCPGGDKMKRTRDRVDKTVNDKRDTQQ